MRYRNLTIGSGPGSDVSLNTREQCANVSSKHAVIFYDDVSVFTELWICKIKHMFHQKGYEKLWATQLFHIRNRGQRSALLLWLYWTRTNAGLRQSTITRWRSQGILQDRSRNHWPTTRTDTLRAENRSSGKVIKTILSIGQSPNAFRLKNGAVSVAELQLCHTTQVNAWLGGNCHSKPRNASEVRLHFICICNGRARYTRWGIIRVRS